MGLEQAVANEMIQKNPALNIKMAKAKKCEARVLTREEQEKIVKAAPLYTNGEIFILMLFTGVRIGEAAALTWNDIDFEENFISVNKTQEKHEITQNGQIKRVHAISTPKTPNSIRKVPMIPKLAKTMQLLKMEYEKKKLLLGDGFNHSIIKEKSSYR